MWEPGYETSPGPAPDAQASRRQQSLGAADPAEWNVSAVCIKGLNANSERIRSLLVDVLSPCLRLVCVHRLYTSYLRHESS